MNNAGKRASERTNGSVIYSVYSSVILNSLCRVLLFGELGVAVVDVVDLHVDDELGLPPDTMGHNRKKQII